MTTYYSASTGLFYSSELFGSKLPKDAVAISDQEHQALLNGQGQKRIVSDGNGKPVLAALEPETLQKLAERKRRELDQARDDAFAVGLKYNFNGEIDVVQTRSQDQINLLGLSAKAQRLIAAGQPDATLTFRGGNNVNHDLTATEINELTLEALGYIESIYERSWEVKDRLAAAEKNGDRDTISSLTW